MTHLKANPEKIVLDAVLDNPGASFSRIIANTELPPSLVHGILRTLERQGRIYIDEQENPQYQNVTRKVYPIVPDTTQEAQP